jgi:hypothetical protein
MNTPTEADTLRRALQLIDALMPGVRHIALQDYALLNDVPLEIKARLKALEKPQPHSFAVMRGDVPRSNAS